MVLNLCHLYYDCLSLHGDKANITAIVKRCSWRDININVSYISLGDHFCAKEYDVIYIGGGQSYENRSIHHDLINNKSSEIRESILAGQVYLAVCSGYQLLGKYLKKADGQEIECVGALDAWTVECPERMVGNTVFQCDFLKSDGFDGKITTFENHSVKTYLGEGIKPLGTVVKGYGNNGEDSGEGAIYNNTFCSNSYGSLLPQNPVLADFIIQTALTKKYAEFEGLTPLNDEFEMLARDAMLSRVLG